MNLQTDLLRTFVTAADLGNYTETGRVLGRTQPAISLQIKRLEQLLDRQLVKHSGKKLNLTGDGQMLLSYARQILQLNDSAASQIRRSNLSGVLRVGLPIDYSIGFFQSEIVNFMQENTGVELDILCGWSRDLLDLLHADQLDIVIAVTDSMPMPYVSLHWSERPYWVCGRDFSLAPGKPVPLVVHPEGCAYRARMLHALEATGQNWRIAFCSPGINALQNAVISGLGISALTRKTYQPGMRKLVVADGFPPLPPINVGIFYKHIRLSDAAIRLVERISNGVAGFQKTIIVRNHK
ncbi:LysR substrate-binding domain-containing protein [Hoeflea sp. YIM 152468]|uniref:LysR substrate-binding domain-containing protein n=1 Tax=Hoeflea sp. YIM 152468 TaxID=3031759 RepID=UPI0023DB9103|nr:LysR substrate-binding domain-containing protein [Hoeflea sp. YIM 152468]MDF1610162.1 LysR substrate-binding domain-containing protein [Hoeflea sp. YIM 152468]